MASNTGDVYKEKKHLSKKFVCMYEDSAQVQAVVMLVTMSGISPICTCNWLYVLSLCCRAQVGTSTITGGSLRFAQHLFPAWTGQEKLSTYNPSHFQIELMPGMVAIIPVDCMLHMKGMGMFIHKAKQCRLQWTSAPLLKT